MKNEELQKMIIFFFENACIRTSKKSEDDLVRKVKNFLLKLAPNKIWQERGLLNRYTKKNVFPDFVILLNNKLIACEVEKNDLNSKFELYNGVKLFDEIWFFTTIPLEKPWLHYKFENKLRIPQKFFGLNKKNEIVLIKEIH